MRPRDIATLPRGSVCLDLIDAIPSSVPMQAYVGGYFPVTPEKFVYALITIAMA